MAAAGYGKSTVCEAERPLDGVTCSAADVVEHGLPRARWIGVEDVHELDLPSQQVLAGMLGELSPQVGVCLTSRTPWTAAFEQGLSGPSVSRGPADLALAAYPVARLLADEYAVQDPEAASRVMEATRGWPLLVRFAAEVLVRHPDVDLVDALSQPDATAGRWIRSVVLAGLPEKVGAVLGVVAGIGPITPAVCRRVATRLGIAPVDHVVDQLRRQGVLIPRPPSGASDVLDVVPVVGRVLAADHESRLLDPDLLRGVAADYVDEGLPVPALTAYARAGAAGQLERLLVERGAAMVRGGAARAVEQATAQLAGPPSPALRRIRSDALRRLGDGAGARRVLAPLLDGPRGLAAEPALATMVATAHYTEGDLVAALEALDAVEESAVGDDLAGIEWRTTRVQVLAMLGRRDAARPVAAEALRLANRSGDPVRLSAAHLSCSRVSDGARKEAHLEAALRAAEQSGDLVTAALARVNQSHHLLASARYAEAVGVAREALRLSAGSPTGRLPAALHNLAEALTLTGAFDEAKWQLRRAVAHGRRLGPGRTASGLLGLADIHRLLGQDEQARAAYQESLGLARESGELQILVPALAGLARLHAQHGQPEPAADLAGEAQELATQALLPYALIAGGWVALAHGAGHPAADLARKAAQLAGAVPALDLLAEAHELLGAATDDASEARIALGKAHTVWTDGGATVRAARVELLLGRLPDADGAARSRARDAARLLQRIGVVGIDGRPVEPHQPAPVSVHVLGGFSVRIGTQPVPLPAWRSRQARTLVKILAVRRGRPVTREHLCELLWPDDDPARTGHRLSVLLATVRSVLDPAKAWPPDRFLVADAAGLRLDLTHVAVDADTVLHDAAAGAELMEAGEDVRALEILTDVDARYAGDALEDEAGEEWADGFREEVRGAWLRTLRRLAALRRRHGRVDEAQRLLLRLLVADPYDEQVHAMLVRMLTRAGRHGEAHRAFARWRDAMAAIDAPLPDPAVLATVEVRGRQAPRPVPVAIRPALLAPRPAL